MLKNWLYQDARWWQFWMPQSGLWGGVILWLVALALVIAAHIFYIGEYT